MADHRVEPATVRPWKFHTANESAGLRWTQRCADSVQVGGAVVVDIDRAGPTILRLTAARCSGVAVQSAGADSAHPRWAIPGCRLATGQYRLPAQGLPIAEADDRMLRAAGVASGSRFGVGDHRWHSQVEHHASIGLVPIHRRWHGRESARGPATVTRGPDHVTHRVTRRGWCEHGPEVAAVAFLEACRDIRGRGCTQAAPPRIVFGS